MNEADRIARENADRRRAEEAQAKSREASGAASTLAAAFADIRRCVPIILAKKAEAKYAGVVEVEFHTSRPLLGPKRGKKGGWPVHTFRTVSRDIPQESVWGVSDDEL